MTRRMTTGRVPLTSYALRKKMTQPLGEPRIVLGRAKSLMIAVSRCRTVTVHTFRGDRTSTFVRYLLTAIDDQRNGQGAGPSRDECLFFFGHTGVSTDADQTVFGFNPDAGNDPAWLVFQHLRNAAAYPGIVRDDTSVFAAAGNHGLTVLSFDVILPEPGFRTFQKKLIAERKRSQFTYGYPDGDGDCNCVTWLERLGLPLLMGRMDEFTRMPSVASRANRRFGVCN